MEYREFVQWCANQYLQITDRFKGRIYSASGSYAPYLVERKRLEKAVYLTALFNGISLRDFTRIEETLNVSYEQIHGTWKGEKKICMNLSRYPVYQDIPYQVFFLTLLVLEDELYYTDKKEKYGWIERYMVDLPILWESGEQLKPLSVDENENMKCLQEMLRDYSDFFYPVDAPLGRRFCMDYMRICNFYEYYWCLAEYGVENGDVLKKLK